MHLNGQMLSRSSRVRWRVLLYLTALALFLRAQIPAGYMPTFASGQGAAFAENALSISYCGAWGGLGPQLQELLDERSNKPADPAQHAKQQACVFGALASQALMPGQDSGAPLRQSAVRVVLAIWRAPPLAARPFAGPPLGSRAPPFFLG